MLQTGDRLVLCSDGLWGTVNDERITQQIASHPISHSVPELVEQALREGGPRCDNVSVLAVEWEAESDTDSQAEISTQVLAEDVFASTIQAGMPGSDFVDDLDEAEIDRSIKEINDAIARSAQMNKKNQE
jgi:hypothetical protein